MIACATEFKRHTENMTQRDNDNTQALNLSRARNMHVMCVVLFIRKLVIQQHVTCGGGGGGGDKLIMCALSSIAVCVCNIGRALQVMCASCNKCASHHVLAHQVTQTVLLHIKSKLLISSLSACCYCV